jgi:hypothetical protein
VAYEAHRELIDAAVIRRARKQPDRLWSADLT